MYRHGVRSWYSNFPTETIDPSIWNIYGGYAQLTSAGVKQMTRFGAYIKELYRNELSFSESKVYAKSTDRNRTILSTKAFLTGLLGNNTVPINVTKHELDNVGRFVLIVISITNNYELSTH